jgi:butyryl-CoA dehydrogenase
MAKSWPSQWCVEANSLAIQVHGGYGYTKEFDVEQGYRDNRLNSIHEGTHGIHGLDLLGRKVVMADGAGLSLLTERINETISKALKFDSTAAYAQQLRDAVQRLVDVTATLWDAGDVATTLANSTIYLEAAGHVVVAWMWLEQLIAANDYQGDFYDGKRAAAQYFYAYELPKVGPQFDLLASLDRTTVDAQASWF